MKGFGLFNLIIFLTPVVNADILDKVVEAGLKQSGYDKRLEILGKDMYHELISKEYRPLVENSAVLTDVLIKKQITMKWDF